MKDIYFYLGEATKKIIDLTVIFTPIRGAFQIIILLRVH